MDIETVSVEKQKNTKNNINKNQLRILLFVILWGAFVYGGYWYIDWRLDRIQAQINQSIDNVHKENILNIEEFNEKLSNVEEEMQEISEDLERTGKSVSKSGSSTREELNTRMIELDTQLEELRKSLEILKESKGEVR